MNYDDIIKEMEKLQRKMFEDFFKDLELEEMDLEEKDNWDIKKIDKPGIKGFVMRRSFTNRDVSNKNPKKSGNDIRLGMKKEIKQDKREPLYDIVDYADSINIYIELPGVESTEIDINHKDGMLDIKAGEFSTEIKLPETSIAMDEISKTYRNGVLTIKIPKN